MSTTSFGAIIRDLRKSKRLSVPKLATLLSMSQSYLYDLEHDRRTPSTPMLQRLATFFNVTTDYLMGRENIKKEPARKGELNALSIHIDNIDHDVYTILMYNYSHLHLHGEEGLTMVTDARLTVPKFQLLEIDDKNPPFAVRQDISFNLTGRGISPADGAVVINPKYTNVESGRIYLVVYNKEILLRQVSYSPDGGYTLEADNGVHAEVPGDAVANGNFRIIGRAVMSTRGL
ncbi:XRE family transcriptional regulator [Pyramidobacter piscolens]|uniref:XRE family transcriptional regulator n=1 Tax=Pyramidobacter piscolens TaxID=638849 RepID=UPI001FCB235D|nr:helix-turn-helix domain-containing protein [Pyramidobacter piscolens]